MVELHRRLNIGPPPLGSWRVNGVLALAALLCAAVTVSGAHDVHLAVAHGAAVLLMIATVFGLGALVRRWHLGWGDGLVAGAWALTFLFGTTPLTFVALRTKAPLRDTALAAFDRAIGLGGVHAWLGTLPIPWWYVYDALIPLLVVVVLLAPPLGHARRVRVLLMAYALAFAVAFPVLCTVQAVGPWTVYGFDPAARQLDYLRVLSTLKAPGRFEIDPLWHTGIVCFPSFHTLLAALAGWALAPVRRLGVPAVALAAGIIVSTVATGWHFVADVLAGLVLAAGCVAAALLADRRLNPPTP